MIKLELNNNYSYQDLEKVFEEMRLTDPNMVWKEYGDSFVIGDQFIVIFSTETYSFVMTGYNDVRGAIFKLVNIS